jgi:hypothetical protein
MGLEDLVVKGLRCAFSSRHIGVWLGSEGACKGEHVPQNDTTKDMRFGGGRNLSEYVEDNEERRGAGEQSETLGNEWLEELLRSF